MGTRNNLSFVDKNHSAKGILSLVLGGMSWITAIVLVILSFSKNGNAGIYIGSCGIVAMITAGIGIWFAISGLAEKETSHLSAGIGLSLNLLILAAWIAMFISGI